jgi:peptide/nickel transport system permease protein
VVAGSWWWFAGRKVAALALTIVLAPTIVWTVFNGLRGTGGQPLPDVALDYVVQTYWHFDLGRSSAYADDTIADVMISALPADLGLVVGSTVVGIALGMVGGLVVASHPRSKRARAVELVTAMVLSTPPYWFAFMVLIFFASGTGYILELPFVSGLMDYVDFRDDPLGWLKAMWMPWVVIGLPLAAAVLRMTAATLRETAGEEFLRTARAKGVSEKRVIRRHALPLAIAPVAALTGANMALLITNVALVESAFNIPGIYRYIRTVYSFADLPMIQAMVIETTVLIAVANMLADLVQGWLDPRLR